VDQRLIQGAFKTITTRRAEDRQISRTVEWEIKFPDFLSEATVRKSALLHEGQLCVGMPWVHSQKNKIANVQEELLITKLFVCQMPGISVKVNERGGN
jgi:hypothetical protein